MAEEESSHEEDVDLFVDEIIRNMSWARAVGSNYLVTEAQFDRAAGCAARLIRSGAIEGTVGTAAMYANGEEYPEALTGDPDHQELDRLVGEIWDLNSGSLTPGSARWEASCFAADPDPRAARICAIRASGLRTPEATLRVRPSEIDVLGGSNKNEEGELVVAPVANGSGRLTLFAVVREAGPARSRGTGQIAFRPVMEDLSLGPACRTGRNVFTFPYVGDLELRQQNFVVGPSGAAGPRSAYDAIVAAFPGFAYDEEVNGADLVEWVNSNSALLRLARI